MTSQIIIPKEKYEALIKEIRLQRSIPVLEKIYEDLKSNKEDLFNDSIVPFQFSSDLIWFLQNNIISVQMQLDIFKLYVEAFFNPKNKIENINQIKFIFDIFIYDTVFYSQSSNIGSNFKVFLTKFFNLYYPKDTSIKHKEGDIMDVYINEERNKSFFQGWIQLKIKKIDEEKKLYFFPDYKDPSKEINIPMDSFLAQERNTFVKEEEMKWRDNLKPGDKIDFLTNNNQWIESEVTENISENEINIDYIGQADDNLKLVYNKYSPYIQPHLKYSYKYDEDEMNCIALLDKFLDFNRYNFIVPITENNHLVPYYEIKFYSLEYFEIMNFFINKMLESKILMDESTSIEKIYTVLNILMCSYNILNQRFIGEYIEKNCLENIKKILMKFSLDKKVNKQKLQIENILLYLQLFVGFIHYKFQLCKIFPEFMIEFGYNCFKNSENLEKRLLGLSSIFKIIVSIKKYYSILPDDIANKISKKINDKLFCDDPTSDLLGLLYNDPNTHEQLLLKGVDILHILGKLKLLKDKDIERLYNFSYIVPFDSDLFNSIFMLLNIIAKEMDLSQQKVVFNKIISLPYEKIREKDSILMSYILQNIKNDNDFKEMAQTYLDFYYNYIIQYQKYEENALSQFAKILTYAKSEDNIKYLYCHYFEKTVNDLNIQDNLEDYKFYFTFIYYIFGCMEDKDEKVKECLPFIKSKFREIFLKDNKNMEIIVDKLMELNGKDNKDENSEKNNENNITDIIDIIQKLIDFIEAKNFYTVESMKKLSEYYIFSDVLRKKRSNLLYKINQFKQDEFDKDKFLEYFFNRFDKFLDEINPENPEKYKLLDDLIITSVFHIYLDINKPKKEKLSKDTEIDDYLNSLKEYTSKENPLKSKYFDIIWKMFSKYNYCIELCQFLELFSLKKFSPSERREIWEKLVQKIFENIENNVPLSLKMLELIINISEVCGSGGAKSHYIEMNKKFPVKLNIYNDISNILPEFVFTKEEEPFYSTDTIYDLKKRVKDKYGIDPIFIEIEPTKSKIYNNIKIEDNKALFQIYPDLEKKKNEEFNIYFKKSKILSTFQLYPLKTDNGITPKFEQILKEIFYKFAKGDKLELNDYNNFFLASIRGEAHEEMEKKSVETFHRFDAENKGSWSFDNFLVFFVFSLESKKNSILLNLNNLGYTPSLDYYLSPLKKESIFYYEENNEKEFMPRYFIGNNKEYMEKIFSFAKNEDKNILGKAQNLLQELCTSEEMKKNLFEKGNKIEEIISDDNLEIRGYAFNILLNEFGKEENENKQNLVNNFINNNLKKLINELEKFSNEKNEKENKESKIITFYNFYLSNLKIIFYAFKNIMGNSDIIDSIEKYESLEDDNKKNVFKETKIELNENQKNLIQYLKLNNLINIIGNNIIIINSQTTDTYRQGIYLSIKLLIYIVLFSQILPEKEKIEIYNNYISLETTLVLESSYYIKSLFYTANKLLLNFMNSETDQIYILTKFDQLCKEIIRYDELNKYEWKLLTFIDMFIDLFDISIKGTQNEKIFSLFENILKIILDKNIELKEYLLKGYLKIIKKILKILKNEKYNKLFEYNFESLIQKIINEFLISFDKDENNQIIEIKDSKNYSKYSDGEYVNYIFQILTILISLNPEKYLKIFFQNEEIKNLREKHLTKIDETLPEYNPYEASKNINKYIGLRNLSSICYMNSVLQQFFMIPLFRYGILSIPIPQELQEDKEDNDNLLFQLIRMFYYLNYSDRGEYNPKNFVYSFKDFDGNPTRIDIQCDAQEFLSRFIEKVEDSIKNNKQRFLCNNIFGGTTLQQVKCTNPECGNISEKRDNINFLSLDIKNVRNVEECLSQFIKEEKIEDYHCEKCDKKITNIKNVLIDKIPNILIIHLQRITFSYETFNMVKINTRITFNKTLNIKKYTVNRDNPQINSEYYEYDLQGILIHSGTAQYGHYYSLIKNEKNKENDNWLKFNDSQVTNVDYESILSDAFGNTEPYLYGSSAYMLIYQKRIKKPVIINSKELDEKTKKILEDKKEENMDKIEVDKNKIYYIYENEKDAIEKNTDMDLKENKIDKDIIIKNSLTEGKLVSYEYALNLLLKENNEEKGKKPFLKTILLENIKICNDKKFYTDSFNKLIKEETTIIKEEIFSDETNQKINEYIPILKTINDYAMHIIPFYNHLDNSDIIIQNLIDIYEYSKPKELLSYLIKDVIEINKDNFYENYFCNREIKKSKFISSYISRILTCCINNDIETELTFKIIQFYLDKIPVEITKHCMEMEGFNNFVLILVEQSNKIKKYFIEHEAISKLIDLMLGKESPLYENDERIENKNNKPKFSSLIKIVALLYKYYADNYQKEELKLPKNDKVMIYTNRFYEKVLMDEYDSDKDINKLLIEYLFELDMVLNKGEEFNKGIIDIIVKLKIPSLKTKEEIISGIDLVTLIIKKYVEIYNINNNQENNNEKFLEKMNILLGIPIPEVKQGDAIIKYLSGRYHDKFTILTNIYASGEKKKESLEILKPLFNLFNLNNISFDYINKLPAPNSYKFSFVDYYIKLYLLKEKEIEDKELNKELNVLMNEICSKYNKDINNIKNSDIIDLDNSLDFHEINLKTVNDISLPENVILMQGKRHYINRKNVDVEKTQSNNLIENKENENLIKQDKIDIHTILYVILVSEKDQDIIIEFKPYIYSTLEIKAKKDKNYYLYCVDINDNIKNNDNEIFKLIDYSNLKIKTEESKEEILPSANKIPEADEGCKMNCSVCGTVNILDEGNPEFKCIFCESPLF